MSPVVVLQYVACMSERLTSNYMYMYGQLLVSLISIGRGNSMASTSIALPTLRVHGHSHTSNHVRDRYLHILCELSDVDINLIHCRIQSGPA